MQVPPEALQEIGRLQLEKSLAIQHIERQQVELQNKDAALDQLRAALDKAGVPVTDEQPEPGNS